MVTPARGTKISVITPCLNGARYLDKAVESVLVQGYSNTQHVVADGGSTDRTLEILGRHSHLTVISSPDRGMYDALNKALAVTRGDIIGILNTDDCYADAVFPSIVEAFHDDSVMAVAGEALAFRETGNGGQIVVRHFAPAGSDLLLRSTMGDPTMNAWFFRASVFSAIGHFDADYKVAGDREFMLRLALSGLRCAKVDKLIYRYRVHAGSMTFGASEVIGERVLREHNRMTAYYLRRPGLSKRARKLIRGARTRDTLRAAIRAARQFHVRELAMHALAGTRHDLLWPARLSKRAIESALKIKFREHHGRD